MPSLVSDIFGFLGILLRALGFLVAGVALGRLVFEHFAMGDWRLQAILALGIFGLLIGITAFSSPGSAGAFALGLGGAYFMTMMPKKTATEIKTETTQP